MTQDPFGDIPLFREIQKILSSSEGPINFEIARQVANALNQDAPASSGDSETAAVISDAVRQSELVVSGYARLSPEEPIRTAVVNRTTWISSTLDSWQWLLAHLAERFSSEVSRFASERGDEVNPMGAVMGQIAPLLLGMQTGTLIGQLARESLGRYDPAIPREDDGRLFYVTTNLDTTIADYGFERDRFLRWLALQDVARHLVVTTHPWVARYRRSLFIELVDSLEIDASDLEQRLVDLQSRGPEALQEGLGGADALPIVATERHRRARGRLFAFSAMLDGYANHVAGAVGLELVGDDEKIAEGMRRRTASPSEGRAMLQSLLGIAPDPTGFQAGTTFCAAIVELKGINALDEVWAAPDNLPTSDEIKDPFQWMERVLDDG